MLDAHETTPEFVRAETALERFDALNAVLGPRTLTLLDRFVSDDRLHPRLINTLSLLEHMGSRKIMATQQGDAIDQPTLRHLAEECHHAFFMKRQAEKTARRPLEYVPDDLLAPAASRMYFQRMEAAVLRRLEQENSAAATYLYMSMLIEFRAVWFYSLYDQALRQHDHAMSLKRLLGEEQNHLTEMAERLEDLGELSDARIERFLGIEHALYERLLGALERTVDAGKPQ